MGTIADKLAYTKQARNEIQAAIVAKGVPCPSNAPFCEFDTYIEQIEGGVRPGPGPEPSTDVVRSGILVKVFHGQHTGNNGTFAILEGG